MKVLSCVPVVVLASKCCQKPVIGGEGHCLDFDHVQCQSAVESPLSKPPHNHISLEAHMSHLGERERKDILG